MIIGGHLVTPERLERLRVLCSTPGLSAKEIADQLGMPMGSLFAMKREARRRGIVVPYAVVSRRGRPSRPSSPAWKALPDNDANEWGRSELPRCKCGLLLPCAKCLPDTGREMQTARSAA